MNWRGTNTVQGMRVVEIVQPLMEITGNKLQRLHDQPVTAPKSPAFNPKRPRPFESRPFSDPEEALSVSS